jgi:beta-lactamase class A
MATINTTLKSLGVKQTLVQRKMIDQLASGRGEENISTPADAVKILQTLYKGEFINKKTSAEILSILKRTNRESSRIASSIPAEVPIAYKPGSIDGVSTEWTIVELKARPYAVAMMENYKVKGRSEKTFEEISAVLYNYFWRIGNSTRYGTYLDPALIK